MRLKLDPGGKHQGQKGSHWRRGRNHMGGWGFVGGKMEALIPQNEARGNPTNFYQKLGGRNMLGGPEGGEEKGIPKKWRVFFHLLLHKGKGKDIQGE